MRCWMKIRRRSDHDREVSIRLVVRSMVHHILANQMNMLSATSSEVRQRILVDSRETVHAFLIRSTWFQDPSRMRSCQATRSTKQARPNDWKCALQRNAAFHGPLVLEAQLPVFVKPIQRHKASVQFLSDLGLV